MKKITIAVVLMVNSSYAFTQNINISGAVRDKESHPVSFAFVRDANHNYATYADSTGYFHLKADPASKLIAAAPGFKTTVVEINNAENLKILMETDSGAADSKNADADNGGGGFNTLQAKPVLEHGNSSGDRQTTIITGFNKEDTQGSPLLFDKWVNGFGVNSAGKLVQIPAYRYNYDKVTGNLMFKNGSEKIMLIDENKIKSFMLFDDQGSEHLFETVPAMSRNNFIEVLASGKRYAVYKVTTAKLVAANFKTNGIITTGNKYDEFKDEIKYYVTTPSNANAEQFYLKNKSIKEKFGPEAQKAVSSSASAIIDDNYLKHLGALLNQE